MLNATLRSFYSYCCEFHKPKPSAVNTLIKFLCYINVIIKKARC